MHYIYGGVAPGNLLIDHCNFAGNAMHSSSFSNNSILLEDIDCVSSSISNTVSNGGCVFANNFSFLNSTCNGNIHQGATISGGLVCSNSSTLDLSSFGNNQCKAALQGGLLLAQSQVNVSRSVFSGNNVQADSIVGAIANGVNADVSASSFSRNNASSTSVQKGGLFAQSLALSECYFAENSAEGALLEGTAVWASSGSIASTSFSNNVGISSAHSAVGGALWLDTSSFSLTDVSFTNNSADLGGGYSINHLSVLPVIDNVTMIDNQATAIGNEVFIIGNQMHSYLQCSEFILDSGGIQSSDDCGSSIASLNATKWEKFIWPSQKFEIDLILVDWFNNMTFNPFYEVSLAPSPFMSSTV